MKCAHCGHERKQIVQAIWSQCAVCLGSTEARTGKAGETGEEWQERVRRYREQNVSPPDSNA